MMKVSLVKIWTIGKVLLVPTIAAFLSFVFVVIKPWSRLGGQYAFLSYTTLILFFFPNPSVVIQLETTFLGILGSALGLGWSNATLAIAAYCGRRYGADSALPNTVIGIGLAILSFICGFIRSYAPRFTAASRIALFFPIFLLTANTAIFFTEHFLVTCFAAVFALIPALIFARGSSSGKKLGSSINDSLKIASELLPISLSSVLGIDLVDRLNALEADQNGSQSKLATLLKKSIAFLTPTFNNYVLEFSRSRLPHSSLHPIVKGLERIHRNPLLGQTIHVPGERIQHALRRTYGSLNGFDTPRTPIDPNFSSIATPRRGSSDGQRESRSSTPIGSSTHVMRLDRSERGRSRSEHSRTRSALSLPPGRLDVVRSSKGLVTAIQQAMFKASAELSRLYQWTTLPNDTEEKGPTLLEVKDELESALSRLAKDLASFLDDLSAQTPRRIPSSDGTAGQRDHFRLAFYMTALLDLAKDVITFLDVVIRCSQRATSKSQWHLPHIPGISRFRKDPAAAREENTNDVAEEVLDEDLSRQDEEDFVYNEMDFATASRFRSQHTPLTPKNWQERIIYVWRRFWDDRRIVKRRIVVSKFLHSVKTSPHVYFAIKLAGGISLLAVPAYLSPDSPGRRYYDHYRGAWAVISYMFVLETHTGAIFKIGLFRFLGTFIGAVGAFVCSEIAHDNPYALVVLATALTIPISYLILMTNYPPIGIVAGITLPPVLFISYLDLLDGDTRFQVAWTRFVEINIGIAAAILIGSFVWPNHARIRYFRTMALTFERATEYYLRMSRDLLRPSLVYKGNTKEYNRLEAELRKHIATCRLLIDIQRKEVSLLPRPIKLYAEVVDAVDRLIETFAEVRLLRFSVPRKTAVFDVMPLRRELISAILINLWALNQSFRSRSPLPQFLPPPRHALEEIMAYMDELAGTAHKVEKEGKEGVVEGRDSLGILYGMAENEALGEVCNVLEELVAAAGTLFGTRTFMGRPRESGS